MILENLNSTMEHLAKLDGLLKQMTNRTNSAIGLWDEFFNMVKLYSHLPQNHEDITIDDILKKTETQSRFMLILQSAIHCLLKQSAYDKWNDVMVPLYSILSGLKESFEFCKYIDTEFNQNLQQIGNVLGALFRNTHQTLKICLEWFENLHNSYGVLKDVKQLKILLEALIGTSQVLTSIDIMASIAVWKSIKRLCMTHKSDINMSPEMCKMLSYVYQVTDQVICQCYETDAATEKLLKVLRFFLGMTLQITKDINNIIIDDSNRLFHLLVKLQSWSMKNSFTAYEEPQHEKQFSIIIDAALGQLLTEFTSVSNAVSLVGMSCEETTHQKDRNEKTKLSTLILISKVLEKLSDLDEHKVTQWLQIDKQNSELNHCCILETLFSFVEQCSRYMFCNTKEIRLKISKEENLESYVYEYILSRLCMFCSTMPPGSCFSKLESLLCNCLLSNHSSKYVILLATDLWCFIIRWGPPQMCLHHLGIVGNWILELQTADVVVLENLTTLFQRLLWFLPDNEFINFLNQFPISPSTVSLWVLVPISNLAIENQETFCSSIVTTAISLMQIQGIDNNCDSKIVNAIKAVANIATDKKAYSNISEKLRDSMTHQVVDFWSCFVELEEDIEMNEALMIAMCDITTLILHSIDDNILVEVLRSIHSILVYSESISFHITCCGVLSSFKDVKFPDQIESSCLSLIAKMFQYLLTSETWMVELFAMEALKEFAEVTIYSTALRTFLPALKKKEFSKYLKKVPFMENSCSDNEVLQHIYDSSIPPIKTFDDVNETKLLQLTECIENDTRELLKTTNGKGLPKWCHDRLEIVKKSLDTFKS